MAGVGGMGSQIIVAFRLGMQAGQDGMTGTRHVPAGGDARVGGLQRLAAGTRSPLHGGRAVVINPATGILDSPMPETFRG